MSNDKWTPRIENGVCINGCLPATDDSMELCESMQAGASSIAFSTVWEAGEMPILKWDDAFVTFLNDRCEMMNELRDSKSLCVLPWEVLNHLSEPQKKSDRLYFSQGGLGSCMGHADAFALASSTLTQIALGHPLAYESFNPVVTWAISKGGSTRGGQMVAPMARYANDVGHFPESLVGNNNQKLPEYRKYTGDAKNYQSSIVFIPGERGTLADNIIKCCAGGYSTAIGNSTAVNGCSIDKNGVKVADLRGTWYHATHFTGYRKVKGTEYIGWVNSHGPKYKSSDEGEPADMCWMTRALVEQFVASASGYGPPYAVLPESVTVSDTKRVKVPFPKNWRS